MPLPSVRFTIGREMVAVAVLAGVMEGAAFWQKSAVYREKARYHAQMGKSSLILIIEGSEPVGREELARLNRIRAAYHNDLRLKYDRAAAHPWVYVSPDPPEPVPLGGPGRRVDLNFGE